MRLTLREVERTAALVHLEAELPPLRAPSTLRYETRTGALALLDGSAAGAFDREHRSVVVPPSDVPRTIELYVERYALPTNRLPSGDGIRWRRMLRRAREEPVRTMVLDDAVARTAARSGGDLPLWGHSHLDVAWLWAYSETRRKAMRTFANALALLEREPAFTFMQSQPQLYAYVEEADPAFFERVVCAVASGRFSMQPAALWVEPDCNLISGESLLRQMLAANRYCVAKFGATPSIAWLPDTFGFPNTLPSLLAHAGIAYFATTKLQWNDTNRFPYPRFRWRGPDGACVTAAILDSYEGSADARRIEVARARREPLVIGYGDGGGGPTLQQIDEASAVGRWQTPLEWFHHLEREALPEHADELYLEYHRGTYTTHHDVKAANASLERALTDVEERLAWCVAVRAPRDARERLCARLAEAWEIVLRNQFHDVLPGTSVRAAYDEALDDYANARAIVDALKASADAMLPRAPRRRTQASMIAPVADRDDVVFQNGFVYARLNRRGTMLELRCAGGPNVVAQANLIAAYRDRPKKWEAWNLDAGYQRKRLRVRPHDAEMCEDAFVTTFDVAGSPASMRISLGAHDPFLRVDLAVDWRSDRTIVRLENWLTTGADRVLYGAPHGTIARAEAPAKFEVPGQRFACVADGNVACAVFSLDTYGWSARRLRGGGMHLGHSLLRSPRWPDPDADRGEAQFSWAFAPLPGAAASQLEGLWERFALEPRVRLFTADEPLLVAAVKPADDGDGVVVRVRECNGVALEAHVRCGGRMRSVESVDGLERRIGDDARIEGEDIVARMGPFALRSFRVRFE